MKCNVCQEDKELSSTNFEQRKDKEIIRWRLTCKTCMSSKKKLYFSNNIEHIRTRNAKHYQNNKESKQEYYLANKPRIAKAKLVRENAKRKTDGCYRMRKNMSRLVNIYLHKQGAKSKGVSFFQAVGYTLEQLRSHIESLWESWMTWDNYGPYVLGGRRAWNIDHIIPQSSLLYDSITHPNFIKCWSLANMRPLDSLENNSKGKKILSDTKNIT